MIREAPAGRGWGPSRSLAFSIALHMAAACAVAGTDILVRAPSREPHDPPLAITVAVARVPERDVVADGPCPALVDETIVSAADVPIVPTEIDEPIAADVEPALGVPQPQPSETVEALRSIAEFGPVFDGSAPRVRAVVGVGRGESDGVASRGTASGRGHGGLADRAGIPAGSPLGVGTEGAPRFVDPSPVTHRESPAYPARAVRLGLEGNVVLVATVRADGTLESLVVSASSGHDELDAAARECVRLRWTFSALPAEAGARLRRIEIPIRFQLRSPSAARS